MVFSTLKERFSLKKQACLTGGLSAAAVLLRGLAVFFSFDEDVGYFDVSFLSVSALILLLLSLALTALFGWMEKKDLPSPDVRKPTEICSIAVAVSLLVYGLYELYTTMQYRQTTQKIATAVHAVVALTAFLSAVYFLLCFLNGSKKEKGGSLLLLGYVFFLFAAGVIYVNYIDYYTTVNNPFKITMQTALLSAMLYFINEFRATLGSPKPYLQWIFAWFALSLGTYYAIPEALAFLTDRYSSVSIFFPAVVVTAVAAYAVRVILCFISAQKET